MRQAGDTKISARSQAQATSCNTTFCGLCRKTQLTGRTQPCRAAHLRLPALHHFLHCGQLLSQLSALSLQALHLFSLLGEVQLQGRQGSSQFPCSGP